MNHSSNLSALLDAVTRDTNADLSSLGAKIGRLCTDHGLPVAMALNRVTATQEQKLAILNGVCMWLIEHKRASGATEKAVDRQRRANREAIQSFIETGEVGLY